MPEGTPDPIVRSWLRFLRAGSYTARTIDLYTRNLAGFAAFLAGRDLDLATAGRGDVEDWIHGMREAGLSESTIRSRWITIRNFYKWATDPNEGDELDVNPAARVKVKKPDTPPPDVPTEQVVADMLATCTGRDFKARRDRALIAFLAETGARISEACSLTVERINLDHRRAILFGKGERWRTVAFSHQTTADLDKYVRVRNKHRLADLDAFWIGHRGPLTRKGAYELVRARGEQAGHTVHPHQFRHLMAHRWLRSGRSEDGLREFGGWQSAEVMRRYGSAMRSERALAEFDDMMEIRPW